MIGDVLGRTARRLGGAVAIVGAIGTAAVPQPAHAVGPWAAAGIGLGAFALGSALAAPYYWGYPGYYGYPAPYYYAPPAAYYPPPQPYYAPRSCWSPYYRTYVAC
jgi:hypothetical protein